MKNRPQDRLRYVLLLLILISAGCQKAEWKPFTSAQGGFSVLMPDIPVEKTEQANTVAGMIALHMFSLEQKESAYVVTYSDFPVAVNQTVDSKAVLDSSRDGAVASFQGKLLTETSISIDGFPGRDLKIESPDGLHTVRLRIFLVKNRLYQVMIVTTKERVDLKDNFKYLDSFKLLSR
ncbi:MAG: hypothetical protein HGB35_04635 [Geobacteraceae bacterium]|nr:hypothetical protein [Geobacteraceae bacterium]